MQVEDRFDKIYEKIVKQNEEIMENDRKEAKKEDRQNALIFIIICLIIFIICCLLYKFLEIFSMELIGLLFTISMVIFAEIKHRGGKSKIELYEKEFKEKVITMMVKSFDESIEFNPNERNKTRIL